MEKYCTAILATDNNTIRRMRITSWVSKAAYTHSEYVILIACPLQQWLSDFYMHTACRRGRRFRANFAAYNATPLPENHI